MPAKVVCLKNRLLRCQHAYCLARALDREIAERIADAENAAQTPRRAFTAAMLTGLRVA